MLLGQCNRRFEWRKPTRVNSGTTMRKVLWLYHAQVTLHTQKKKKKKIKTRTARERAQKNETHTKQNVQKKLQHGTRIYRNDCHSSLAVNLHSRSPPRVPRCCFVCVQFCPGSGTCRRSRKKTNKKQQHKKRTQKKKHIHKRGHTNKPYEKNIQAINDDTSHLASITEAHYNQVSKSRPKLISRRKTRDWPHHENPSNTCYQKTHIQNTPRGLAYVAIPNSEYNSQPFWRICFAAFASIVATNLDLLTTSTNYRPPQYHIEAFKDNFLGIEKKKRKKKNVWRHCFIHSSLGQVMAEEE